MTLNQQPCNDNARPDSPHNDFQTHKKFTYKSTPTGDLNINFTFPFDYKPTDKRPVIIFFFGGGWINGSVHHFARHAAYLASRGIVAACPEYRIKSQHNSTPIQSIEDAKSAVRWTRANANILGIDPDQLITSGGSAGGHLAACTDFSNEINAATDDLSISPKPNAMVLFNPVMLFVDQFAKLFDLSPQTIKQISPIYHITKHTPPSIQFFGSNDSLLEYGQQYADACQALNIRAEIDITPGQSHAYFNSDPFFKQTLHAADIFLASLKYLTGKPTIQLNDT